MLRLIDDVLTPRGDVVDPDTCPVCGRLRTALGIYLRAKSAAAVRETVRTMHAHMIYGHPNDPRNVRPKTPIR